MANNSATSLCPAYGNKVTQEWSSVWVPLLFIILRTTQFSKTWIKILIHTLCCFLEASVWLFMTQYGRWLATFKLNANALEIGQLHLHKSPGCFRCDWDWKPSVLTGRRTHSLFFSLWFTIQSCWSDSENNKQGRNAGPAGQTSSPVNKRRHRSSVRKSARLWKLWFRTRKSKIKQTMLKVERSQGWGRHTGGSLPDS